MILRKPYALLIKYFQRINIVLLLLVAYVFINNLRLHGFVKEYVSTGIYNDTIASVSSYINIYTYIAFIVIIVGSGVLAYLLRYKDKPYASYVFILIANIITFAFFIYTNNYFTYNVVKGFDLVSAKVVKDILFISTLPYYPMIFLLLVRSIGIDLKSFGFQEDKEFVQINEEDNEEVEVQVGFDKDIFIRKFKNKFRHLRYFFFEHKVPLLAVFSVVFVIFCFNFYRYFYVTNRIYTMNERFKSNNYQITVKNSYLTDKDYAGNVVSENGRYFVLIDINIRNLLNISRDFNIQNMYLYVDNDYYVPTIRFNNNFVDMGNLYDGKSIKKLDTVSYLLVYEIDKPKDNSNFLLKYQDLNSTDNKLIKVKIKILDISSFKNKGESKLGSEFNVPINLNEKVNFTINDYQLLDSVNYTYQQCYVNSCPIYQGVITAGANNKVIYMKGNYGSYTTREFLAFLKRYGKIRYKIGEEYRYVNIKYAVNTNYQGNYIYILVPKEVSDASMVDIAFTIRTYQYFYRLKG